MLSITVFLALLISFGVFVYQKEKEQEEDLLWGGMVPPDDYMERVFYKEYQGRMNEESYIPGYTWQDLADMWLKPYENSDKDKDGLSDYDELIVYKSNPSSSNTADDLYGDYYKATHNMEVSKKYEGYDFQGNECEDWITIKPTTFTTTRYGRIDDEKEVFESSIPHLLTVVSFSSCLESEITVDLSNYSNYFVVGVSDCMGEYYKITKLDEYIENNQLTYEIKDSELFKIYIFNDVNKREAMNTLHIIYTTSFDLFISDLLESIYSLVNDALSQLFSEGNPIPKKPEFGVAINTFPFGNFSSEIAQVGNCIGIAAITSLSFQNQNITYKDSFQAYNEDDKRVYTFDVAQMEIAQILEDSNLHDYKNEEYSTLLNNCKDNMSKLDSESQEFVKFVGYYWSNYNHKFFEQDYLTYLCEEKYHYSSDKIKDLDKYLEDNKSAILVLIGENGVHAVNILSCKNKLLSENKNIICYDSNYPNETTMLELKIDNDQILCYNYKRTGLLNRYNKVLYKDKESILIGDAYYFGFVILDLYGNIIM